MVRKCQCSPGNIPFPALKCRNPCTNFGVRFELFLGLRRGDLECVSGSSGGEESGAKGPEYGAGVGSRDVRSGWRKAERRESDWLAGAGEEFMLSGRRDRMLGWTITEDSWDEGALGGRARVESFYVHRPKGPGVIDRSATRSAIELPTELK
jgi:hypothetical protein